MDIQYLRDALNYDPATGIFRWRAKRKKMNPGDIAGAVNSKGYRYISLQNVAYRANRLAWLHFHGAEPTGHIDHINGDRLDDRIENLRDVTRETNAQNRRNASKNNRSGLLGVTFRADRKTWRAHITVSKKVIFLGTFPTAEEAHQAYIRAKAKYHEVALP